MIVEFFNDDPNQSELDAELFQMGQDVTGGNSCQVLQTSDTTKIGEYPIKYRAFFADYPDQMAVSQTPFVISVVDGCTNAQFVQTSPDLVGQNQEYTILQEAFDYDFPAFITEPAGCPVNYMYSVTELAGGAVVQFNSQTRMFIFGQSEDISLAGDLFTDYTITVTGMIGDPSTGSISNIIT